MRAIASAVLLERATCLREATRSPRAAAAQNSHGCARRRACLQRGACARKGVVDRNKGANPRRRLAGQTGVETAIATARPFLGVRASSLGLQKALDALYNFPAGSQVVGCKPGPQNPDEGGFPTKPG